MPSISDKWILTPNPASAFDLPRRMECTCGWWMPNNMVFHPVRFCPVHQKLLFIQLQFFLLQRNRLINIQQEVQGTNVTFQIARLFAESTTNLPFRGIKAIPSLCGMRASRKPLPQRRESGDIIFRETLPSNASFDSI